MRAVGQPSGRDAYSIFAEKPELLKNGFIVEMSALKPDQDAQGNPTQDEDGQQRYLTRPGIFVPTEVRENLIEEGIENTTAEVEAGADRNDFAAD